MGYQTRPEMPPLRGTARLLAWLGTPSMASSHGMDARLQTRRASVAGHLSRHSSLLGLGSAQDRASKASHISDTKPPLGRVLIAARNLWRTSIGRPLVVPVSVQTRSAPQTVVYNLTLDRDNAYYANGILVFNCLTFAHPVVKQDRRMILPTPRREEPYDIFKQMQ